jgi:catechol 2,3-dioxygenase-like lactoylglutathione lyase family enzyme
MPLTPHARPLGHISIGVQSYDISKTFYSAVLGTLGLKLVFDRGAVTAGKPRTLGYGLTEHAEIINIFEYGSEARVPGRGCHIAFNAPTRQAVIDFHEAAVSHGGASDGAPGLRPHYGENYFAAFVICPDGWRLEAVCQEPGEL